MLDLMMSSESERFSNLISRVKVNKVDTDDLTIHLELENTEMEFAWRRGELRNPYHSPCRIPPELKGAMRARAEAISQDRFNKKPT